MVNLSIMKYVTFFFLTIVITSCSKDECHTFSGRILSFGTNVPVADAVVKIVAGKQVELFEPAVEWITDSVRTGSDGRWEITVTEGDYHKIGPIIKAGFFSDLSFKPRAQLYSLSESGPLSNKDYIIDPKGTLHVIVEDDPNFEENYIELRLPSKGFLKPYFESFEEMYEVRGERFHEFAYKFSLMPVKFDSIFCKPFETTELRIKF